MSAAAIALAGATLLAALSGCAALTSPREAIGDAALRGPASDATPEGLGRLVAGRRAALRGLRATGKLQVTIDARRGDAIRRNRMRASQAILVQSPASFRIEALSPFGTAYAVVSDGAELVVMIPGEGLLYRGAATAETVAVAIGVLASPGDAAELLLGLPPAPPLELRDAWISRPAGDGSDAGSGASAATADPAAVAAGGTAAADGDLVQPEILLHATVLGAPEQLVVIGFAPVAAAGHSLVPVLFERVTDAGELVLRARFGAFRATQAGPLATRVELQAPDSQAVLTYGDLEVNPEISGGSFAVVTPAGMRELRLDVPEAAGRNPA